MHRAGTDLKGVALSEKTPVLQDCTVCDSIFITSFKTIDINRVMIARERRRNSHGYKWVSRGILAKELF